jgi:hypothetical protein
MTVLGVANVTLASQNPNPHVRRVHARKRTITEQRIRTKWRHAMRHLDLIAYRKKVEAMDGSNIKLGLEDRLKEIDEIDKRGSIEQKNICLKNVLTGSKNGILPKFYSTKTRNGMRYPGDGGSDPQVETDHESIEGELEDCPTEAQEPKRHKRGRHQERRRRSQHNARGRRRLCLALSKDPKNSRTGTRTFMDLNALGAALGRKWPIQPSFQIMIEQLQRVRDGREAEASLLTLDTEFISSTRRVLEVAVGEFHSGRVLLEVRVDHQCTTEELLKKTRRSLYGSSGTTSELPVLAKGLRLSRSREMFWEKDSKRNCRDAQKRRSHPKVNHSCLAYRAFRPHPSQRAIGVRGISRRFASTRKLHPND